MWRALFLAVGVYMVLLGAQCLAVERFNLKDREAIAPKTDALGNAARQAAPPKVIDPPDWAPWSLMSTGAIVCLYSFTIPARVKGG